jgi:hypothetical protein
VTASELASEMASTDDAAAPDAGGVANVQPTDTDETGAGDDTSTDADLAQDPFLVLAACTIEPDQADSFAVDRSRTRQSLGLSGSGLGAPGRADE